MKSVSFFFNLAATCLACAPAHLHRRTLESTAITNVHVWNGQGFGPISTVMVFGGLISNGNPTASTTTVDGQGGYLLPGFIDTHCHVTDCSYLTQMREYGVTTALDMGTWPYSQVASCQGIIGVTDLKGSGAAGCVNGSDLSKFPGFPTDHFVSNPSAGRAFVAARIAEGADYIKIFQDPRGPDEATMAAIVQAAHTAGKQVIAHSVSYHEFELDNQAGVDIPTHVPFDLPLNSSVIAPLKAQNRPVSPTLYAIQSLINVTGLPPAIYAKAAEASTTALYTNGVSIIAGTDSNLLAFTPAKIPFGVSLHDELQLLAQAGLSNVDAIRAATDRAAAAFRLYDRGSIKIGFRADLVLLGADPTMDISNSRSIKKVWIKGVETEV